VNLLSSSREGDLIEEGYRMLFSVVIPTYNRLHTLKRALDSVLGQNLDDFEIVIVDDGSEDGTTEYIYGLKNRKIKYIWQENSGLPSVARNRGIEEAKGDWVAFLDSDDFWYMDKLVTIARNIERHPDVIGFSHWEDLSVDGVVTKVLRHGSRGKGDIYEDLLLNGNFFSTSAMVVRRDCLLKVGGFNTDQRYYIVEDYDLWLRLARSGEFFCIEEVLGQYCLSGSENISADIERIHDNLRNLVGDHIKSLNLEPSREEKMLRKHLSRVEYYRGRSYQINGKFDKAIPLLAQSIRDYPFYLKKWLSLLLALVRVSRC
jgi:glycosyltransferase involved in cell wall biosynthesis